MQWWHGLTKGVTCEVARWQAEASYVALDDDRDPLRRERAKDVPVAVHPVKDWSLVESRCLDPRPVGAHRTGHWICSIDNLDPTPTTLLVGL